MFWKNLSHLNRIRKEEEKANGLVIWKGDPFYAVVVSSLRGFVTAHFEVKTFWPLSKWVWKLTLHCFKRLGTDGVSCLWYFPSKVGISRQISSIEAPDFSNKKPSSFSKQGKFFSKQLCGCLKAQQVCFSVIGCYSTSSRHSLLNSSSVKAYMPQWQCHSQAICSMIFSHAFKACMVMLRGNVCFLPCLLLLLHRAAVKKFSPTGDMHFALVL